jgi:hypothetical protein
LTRAAANVGWHAGAALGPIGAVKHVTARLPAHALAQAVAAALIAGQPDIFSAAGLGDVELVLCHLIVSAAGVNKTQLRFSYPPFGPPHSSTILYVLMISEIFRSQSVCCAFSC